MPAKKKENLWQLLKRLDEEAGQFNVHLHYANRYFDTAATKTKGLLEKHEKDLNKAIVKFRKMVKKVSRKKNRNKKGQ